MATNGEFKRQQAGSNTNIVVVVHIEANIEAAERSAIR